MGCVLDVAFAKIVLHQLGPSLCDPKVRANVAHHFLDVHGTNTAQCVGLHILVQQFIRVQLRAVGGQKENSDLCSMLIQPAPHRSGLMDGVTVGNRNTFLFVFRVSRSRRPSSGKYSGCSSSRQKSSKRSRCPFDETGVRNSCGGD